MKKLHRVPDVVILLLYLLIIFLPVTPPLKNLFFFSSGFLKLLYFKRNTVTFVRVYHTAI